MRKIAFLLVLFTLPVMLAACSSTSTPATPPAEQTATSSWVWDGTILSGKHTVILSTTKGDITLSLDADTAPKTVTNFMALAASGYFNGLTFHRVIPGFMIQGGDPDGNGTGGRSIFGEMFEDEIKPDSAVYKAGYKEGVVAMANSGPNTNGSQFFIMDRDYPLPPKYTIFGSVAEGQDVVNAIANAERDPTNDMPKQKVTFVVKVIK